MAVQALIASGVACPLYDPRLAREHRARFFRDDIPELQYANSLFVPSGKWPVRGWVLVRRGDYNAIPNLYATDFGLQIDDFANGPLLFRNLVLVQARCVTRGLAADPNAVYLVELTDHQGVLWNPWAHFPTSSQYNVVSPAYPGQYHLASLGPGGVPWTWDQMVGDLWGQMGAFLGPYPGLPAAPAGTPENYVFVGESCWKALNRVLDYLGLTMSCDLTQAAPYGINTLGGADARFAALLARYAGLLEDDYEWIDAGSGRVPGQVIVYFHRRNQDYGTEETVRNDLLQWSTSPFYAVTVPGPAPYNQAAGTGHLWADFTVRFDVDGNPLAADVATAAVLAQERADDYYARVTRGTAGYLRRVYAGALPFYAGGLVDGVRWFMDFRRPGPDGISRFGWCTELIRGPQPPWPQVEVR